MGIANIINTAGGGGGGGSEIITNLVNSVDGAGLRLANQGYISCADVSANRFGTNDFSVEFVLSQETNAINADIFISNLNGSNQAVDAAVIRWDVIQNDNIQLVFTNSSATETAYNFGYDPAPDLNEPTHYLVSADRSGNAVLYRNGAEIASVSIAASSAANVGNSGQPTVIGSPVNNFGVTGNVYRFRTYSKALSSDEAKNVFDRADVPTALVSNLLLDLDCAYANPTQSTVIQDRGPNNQDGTLNGTITQTNVIKQLNSTSARIGTTAATPADGELLVSGNVNVNGGGYVKIAPADTQADLRLYRDDATINTSGIAIGDINFGGADADNDNAARLRVKSDGAWTSTSSPTAFEFQTCPSGSESPQTRLIIASDGNVGVGCDPDAKLEVNGDSVWLGNASSDASGRILFNENTSSNGTQGFSLLYAGSTNPTLDGTTFTAAANSFNIIRHTPAWGTAGTVAMSVARDTGLATFSAGIAFSQTNTSATGATATGTTLSHYEVGSWTPSLAPGSGSFTTLTYTTQRGRYIRIGSQVWCGFEITVNAFTIGTGASYVRLLGLPFDRAAAEDQYGTGVVTQYTGWNTAAPTTLPRLNAGDCILRYAGNAQGVANVPPSHINAGSSMNGFITFSV